ncbi:MAG: hypothetical protein KatS3mg105_0322 [Gemmatales bacterium]|nr:MAG: hypothetical protein KatS3mg105_0322 [Gemmatales bacterium]
MRALGKIGKDAVSALIERVEKEPVVEVRLAAIVELGNIGPDAKDAVGVLTAASKDGRKAIRDAATEALKKITK